MPYVKHLRGMGQATATALAFPGSPPTSPCPTVLWAPGIAAAGIGAGMVLLLPGAWKVLGGLTLGVALFVGYRMNGFQQTQQYQSINGQWVCQPYTNTD